MWKSQNICAYPTKWVNRKDVQKRTGLKDSNKPELVTKGKTLVQTTSFMNVAANVWNSAPSNIKESKTIWSAKKCIKMFIKKLPI